MISVRFVLPFFGILVFIVPPTILKIHKQMCSSEFFGHFPKCQVFFANIENVISGSRILAFSPKLLTLDSWSKNALQTTASRLNPVQIGRSDTPYGQANLQPECTPNAVSARVTGLLDIQEFEPMPVFPENGKPTAKRITGICTTPCLVISCYKLGFS